MNKRKHRRFTKRLEAKFIADGESFLCITSNLSENGLFIRTKRGLLPDRARVRVRLKNLASS
jgi:hypothetical protein